MKYNTNNLYIGKCRYFPMDMIMFRDDDGQFILPPDFIDYYTILLRQNGEYINIFNQKEKYKDVSEVDDDTEYRLEHLVLDAHSLSKYTSYNKINKKECEIILDAITEAKGLEDEYGYIDENGLRKVKI